MSGSYIVAGARTPIGKMSGGLAGFRAAELGGFAIAAALARAGITGDQVDHVIMGQVLLAGAGQLPARQAAVHGGVPVEFVGHPLIDLAAPSAPREPRGAPGSSRATRRSSSGAWAACRRTAS